MKILHTSDWHIGKKLVKKSRLEEQRAVLTEIGDICDREGVDLLLVAGDIFDTFIPSADAEELFFEFCCTGKERKVIARGDYKVRRRIF